MSHTWALRKEFRKLKLNMLASTDVVAEAVMVPKAGPALKAVEVVFSLHVDLQGNQGVVCFLAFWTRVAGHCCKQEKHKCF